MWVTEGGGITRIGLILISTAFNVTKIRHMVDGHELMT